MFYQSCPIFCTFGHYNPVVQKNYCYKYLTMAIDLSLSCIPLVLFFNVYF